MKRLLAAFGIAAMLAALQVEAQPGPAAGVPTRPFPVRIGLVADSQFTTEQGAWNYGMRRQFADRFVNVAIRPAALEYLAPLLLERTLDSLDGQVDMILYLGDGANSGCKDELDRVFKRLEEARARSRVPSYYVIGNHDYMGTGNQVKASIRAALCGPGNPAETKLQVMARISGHNLASMALDRNFTYAEKRTASPSRYAPADCGDDDNGHFTTRQTAMLTGRPSLGAKVEILLLDTSDYRDIWFMPTISTGGAGCEIIGGWGSKGSLSYEEQGRGESQIGDFVRAASPDVDFRVLASHFRPDNMNMLLPFGWSMSYVRDELGRLLSRGDNIWLSGHTHTCAPRIERFRVGRTFWPGPKGVFDGVNVGSTTDYKPHAVIVGPVGPGGAAGGRGGQVGQTGMGYRLVPAPAPAVACDAVLALARERESMLEPVCGSTAHATALGLDQAYRQTCFREDAVKGARRNIDAFATMAAGVFGTTDREVKACLALAASEAEGPVHACLPGD